ncbi:MAG TPA: hypothetical protein VGG19_17760 [Tepidisphaeraceae bacterium]|jgi:hypothetical protein
MRWSSCTCLGLLIALITITSVQANTYDAVNDFTAGNNPSGQWSYLYSSTIGGLQTALTPSGDFPGSTNPWDWSGENVPDSVSVIKNTSGTPTTYESTIVQPTNLLLVDPEEDAADVQWKAPTTGIYDISGVFQNIDQSGHTDSHPVEVLLNNSALLPLYSSTISSSDGSATFNFDQLVAAGDTLDFVVAGSPSNYQFLSTGFDATISVPEPSLGLVLMGGLILRRTISYRTLET